MSSISKDFVSLIVVLGFIIFQLICNVESNPGGDYAIEKLPYWDLFIEVTKDLELLQVYITMCLQVALCIMFLSSEEGIQVEYS